MIPLRSLLRNQRGSALLISLVLIVVITILGLALFELGQIEGQQAGASLGDARAFEMAQAGMERAIRELSNGFLADLPPTESWVDGLNRPTCTPACETGVYRAMNLATHLLERAAQRLWRQPATVSTEALRCLWTYPWPGNIRELQHVLEGAMVLSDGVILPEHLPPAVQRGAKGAAAGEASPSVTGSLDEALEDWERRAILDALQKARGVQARAAKILGITERSLWYRVKKLKIQVRMTGESPDPT